MTAPVIGRTITLDAHDALHAMTALRIAANRTEESSDWVLQNLGEESPAARALAAKYRAVADQIEERWLAL